jgi:hypothetical protein
MFYKIVNDKVEIPKTDRLIPQKRQKRHSHTKRFQIPSCKTEYRKESFFPRTITDCNKLPENKSTVHHWTPSNPPSLNYSNNSQ